MFNFDSSYLSGIDSSIRVPPPDHPPSPPLLNQATPFQATNAAVIKELTTSNDIHLKSIQTGGGHGGFYLATVTIRNSQGVDETKKLFLKPFDQAEFNNFYFIQKRCEGREDSSILKYMPRVYGEATINVDKENKTQFMVMENLFASDDGKQWSQVADLKMTKGGQYDRDELIATGRTKGLPSQVVMAAQTKLAPDFLTLDKSKLQRSINAIDSPLAFTQNLVDALADMPNNDKLVILSDLKSQLSELSELVKDKTSPMGFIGASVFIFISKTKDHEPEVKIRLADPAHGIAEPSASGIEALSKEQRESMYWGRHGTQAVKNNGQFEDQKKLNSESIEAMKSAVDAFSKTLPGPTEDLRRKRQESPPPLPQLPAQNFTTQASSSRSQSPSPIPSPRLNTSNTPSPKSAPTSIPTSTGTSRSPSPTPSPRKSPSPPKRRSFANKNLVTRHDTHKRGRNKSKSTR